MDLYQTMPEGTLEEKSKTADVLSGAMKSYVKAAQLAGRKGDFETKEQLARMARRLASPIQALRAGKFSAGESGVV